jgi:hypothetical protein
VDKREELFSFEFFVAVYRGVPLAAQSAVSGSNIKLLEWMIEQIVIKPLAKLQTKISQ